MATTTKRPAKAKDGRRYCRWLHRPVPEMDLPGMLLAHANGQDRIYVVHERHGDLGGGHERVGFTVQTDRGETHQLHVTPEGLACDCKGYRYSRWPAKGCRHTRFLVAAYKQLEG